MSKDTNSNLYLTIITILAGIIISILGYWLHKVDQTVDAQSEKITTLDKKLTVIVTILNTKMPNTNWSALMTMSAKKNISQDQLEKLIPMLEKDPLQAKSYLGNQLHFNQEEINTIVNQPSISNNSSVDNLAKNQK